MVSVITDKAEAWWNDNIKSTSNMIYPHTALSFILPNDPNSHIVLEVNPAHIHKITTKSIKIPAPEKIVENYSRRQIPRFK